MNELRLRELHHRVDVHIGGGLTFTRDGERHEIVASKVSCCSCLQGNWEAGPCPTLEAIEDDEELKDVVEIITWASDELGKVELPLEGYRGD